MASFTTEAAAASGTALWGRRPRFPWGQCGGTVLAVSGEETLGMTFAHSNNLGRLGDGKLMFQNTVEHLNPRECRQNNYLMVSYWGKCEWGVGL